VTSAATPESIVATAPTASAPPLDDAKHSASVTPAAKPGTLKLSIQPWGEVYVDGSKRGVSPPISSLSLAPGKHRIEIRNGQFAPQKQTVDVKSGGETTIHTTF
jgi:hypothetical protein